MSINFEPISENIIREQAERFIYEHVTPRGELNLALDGKKHRLALDGDKGSETAGEYCFYTDGCPAGYVRDYRNGIYQNWKFNFEEIKDSQPHIYKQAQTKEFKAEAERKNKEREAKKAAEKIEAIREAKTEFNAAKPATDEHPYFKCKKIKTTHGLKIQGKELLLPLHDVNGNFQAYQRIFENGDKRLKAGTSYKGAFFVLGGHVIKDGDSVILCEGYATAATVYECIGDRYRVIMAVNCHNLYPVAKSIRAKYNVRLSIAADDDRQTEQDKGINPGLDAAKKCVAEKVADGYIKPPFDDFDDDNATDWNDFFKSHGKDETTEALLEALKQPLTVQVKNKPDNPITTDNEPEYMKRVTCINANDLLKKEFPPVKWAVEGFLPMGCSILCGGPKTGKSILSLHLSLAVAIGGMALGKIQVERGSVAYLALEDPQWRLQERILGSDIDQSIDLSKLDLITEIPRQHEGGIEWIKWWLDTHSDARLVIIDTLQKFRRPRANKGDWYADDYEVLSEIKKIADKYSVPILIIHHLKKAKDDDDWLNEVSGSQGISGAVDTVLILKRARGDNMGILRRTGRDVEEKEFALKLDGFGWYLEGDAADVIMSKDKRQIIEYLKEHGGKTPKELADVFNVKQGTMRQRLSRMFQDDLLNKNCDVYFSKSVTKKI